MLLSLWVYLCEVRPADSKQSQSCTCDAHQHVAAYCGSQWFGNVSGGGTVSPQWGGLSGPLLCFTAGALTCAAATMMPKDFRDDLFILVSHRKSR